MRMAGSLLLLLLLQMPTRGSAGPGFSVRGPAEPIAVLLGADATLPCQLTPEQSTAHMDIRWYRSQLSPAVFVYRDGQEQRGEQMLEYRGRTELLGSSGRTGLVTLLIRHARASDDGRYHCHFQDGPTYREATVELHVVGMGSDPHVHMTGPEEDGIRLLCSSGGWFPAPTVQWRDVAGVKLTSPSASQTQDGDGLFHVEASLVVRDSSLGNVTCSVQNPSSGQEKASSIFLPEPFFPRVSPWKVALAWSVPVLVLLLAGFIVAGWRAHRAREREEKKEEKESRESDQMRDEKEKAVKEKENLTAELGKRKKLYAEDWRKALLYPDWRKEHFTQAPVTLRPKCPPSSADPERKENSEEPRGVSLSDKEGDGNLVTFSGKDFSSDRGRYYWEVGVGDTDEWTLGVYEEPADRGGSLGDPRQKKFRVLEKKGGRYRALVCCPSGVSREEALSVEMCPQKVVVFVDYEFSDISFYSMTDSSCLFSFTQDSLSGSLYPYFTQRAMELSPAAPYLPSYSGSRPRRLALPEDCRAAADTWKGSLKLRSPTDAASVAGSYANKENTELFTTLEKVEVHPCLGKTGSGSTGVTSTKQTSLKRRVYVTGYSYLGGMEVARYEVQQLEHSVWRKASLYPDWKKEEFKAVTVTLDAATAHPALHLSENGRQVTWQERRQDLPSSTQRFDSLPCVLGQLRISSGRWYWEVEVGNAQSWDLGVCGDNVTRSGRVTMSPQNGFWAIRLYSGEYWAVTSPETLLSLGEKPLKVGIFLDYEDGDVSFYNMTDGSHIFSFPKNTFHGVLRPLLRLWSSHSGSLTICPTEEK
ncbi:butyrophilin-like protein 1 [Rhynchonycteris naso]